MMDKNEKWGLVFFIFGLFGVSTNSILGDNLFMYLSMIPAIIGLFMFIPLNKQKGTKEKR